MEPYIKDNSSDITYMSELILDILNDVLATKCQGLNSHNNLLALRVRKLCVHLK
jgi:hypothetical protein